MSAAAPDLVSPATLDEALAALAQAPAHLIAGGTARSWTQPGGRFVSLHALRPELRFLALRPEGVKLGALSTWRDVALATALHERLPLLACAARHVGPLAIQSRATVGGHLVRASANGDARAVWLALDAQVELRSRGTLRWVQAADVWASPARRRDDELVVAVRAPLPPADARQLFARRAAPDNSHAPVVVAAIVALGGRTVRHVRLAVGGTGPLPVRLHRTEDFLLGKRLTPTLVDKAVAAGRGEIHPVHTRGEALPAPTAAAVHLLAELLRSV